MNKAQQNRSLATKLFVVSIAMFAFGYALVPLYDVFCELTGLNGKTGRADIAEVRALEVDHDRSVAVEFIANLNQSLDWEFRPMSNKITVRPGEVQTVDYFVKNKTDRQIVAQAVPSVVPVRASAHFDKIDCFCFEQKTFAPGEERILPVKFVVKPSLPKGVKSILLSYTFFDASSTLSLLDEDAGIDATEGVR